MGTMPVPAHATRLRKMLKDDTSSTFFNRGEIYFHEKRISSVTYEEDAGCDCVLVMGKVRGSQKYSASLTIHTPDYSIADFSCDCPVDDAFICKHIVALGLFVVDALVKQPILLEYGGTDAMRTGSTQSRKKNKSSSHEQAVLQKLSSAGIDTSTFSPELIAKIVRAVSKDRTSKTPPASLYQNVENYEVSYTNAKGEIRTAQAISSIHRNQLETKPTQPFSKRYSLFLTVSYDGSIINVQLHDTTLKDFWYYSSQEILPDALLTSTHTYTDSERELLSQLKNYQKKRGPYGNAIHTGIVSLLARAYSLNIPIQIRDEYSSEQQTPQWNAPEHIFAEWSVQEAHSYYTSLSYSHLVVDFSKSLSYTTCWYVHDEDGMVLIFDKTISIYPFPLLLSTLIVRALRERTMRAFEYGKPTKQKTTQTTLLDSEYIHIETLCSLAKKHLHCSGVPLDSYYVKVHTPQPFLEIDYIAREGLLSVYPSVDYGGVILRVFDILFTSTSPQHKGVGRRPDPAFGTTHIIRIDENCIHVAPVSFPLEKKLFRLGTTHGDTGIRKNGRSTYRGKKQIGQFIEDFLPALKQCGYPIRYTHDIPHEIINADVRADFDIDFDTSSDWLSFDLTLYCGNERVQLSDIEACLSHEDAEVLMKDGRIIRITNKDTLKRLVELLAHFRKNEEGVYEGKTYHAPELDAVAQNSPYYTARVSKAFSSFVSEAKVGKIVKSVRIPKLFSSVLRDYQVEGIHWLHFLHQYKFAGILADDMGLGKTLQALAILSIHASKEKTSLIIAPKTLLQNWAQEIARFTPHLKTVVIEGSVAFRNDHIERVSSYDVIITSYSALQQDIETYEKNNICFNYCVLDEAQYVKNAHTKSSHIVRRVKSDYRLALTGTPLENNVHELWALFDFLMPGFLGHHAHFQKTLGNPIMKQSDQEALHRLRTKVSCFMLRRTKETVLPELPTKIEQTISCELSDEQNILYQDVLKRVRKDITARVKKDGFAASHIHILAGLTKLRQICNHPALLLPPKKRGVYPSAKMDACMHLIEQLHAENRKVLIFSQFTSMLDILGEALTLRNIRFNYLSGKTKKRSEEVASFISEETTTVFLISTKAGGVGLNLTVADAVIIFDPWWNPQVEHQAVDRTHRIGQTKTVNVYRLRTVGTIEEKIASLQERKQKLFDALVGDSKDLFKKLTWEDVTMLLS